MGVTGYPPGDSTIPLPVTPASAVRQQKQRASKPVQAIISCTLSHVSGDYALPTTFMVSTTCISAGMIAIGAVLGNMPGISRTVSCAHHGRSAAWWRQGTSCRSVGQGTRTYVIMLCYRAPVVQALEAPTNTYSALGPVAARHSSRASTCWMDCRTRSLCACRTVGVRQHGCRSSRTHDPARGTLLPILVTEVLDVLVTIIKSVRHE